MPRKSRLFLAIVAAALWSLAGAAFAAEDLPEGPNRELIFGRCRTCHGLEYLSDSSGLDRGQWDSVLDSMRKLGMPKLSDEDRDKILSYLATYLGPNPPPETAASTNGSQPPPAADGQTIFVQQCASCHQPDGKGVAGQFPPLAGNTDLFLSREFPALVVLNGMEGEIKVGGKPLQGIMPPFDYLSDAQIAAVVAYVRSAWGNDALRPKDMTAIDAEVVKSARTKSMSASAVRDYRGSLE